MSRTNCEWVSKTNPGSFVGDVTPDLFRAIAELHRDLAALESRLAVGGKVALQPSQWEVPDHKEAELRAKFGMTTGKRLAGDPTPPAEGRPEVAVCHWYDAIGSEWKQIDASEFDHRNRGDVAVYLRPTGNKVREVRFTFDYPSPPAEDAKGTCPDCEAPSVTPV